MRGHTHGFHLDADEPVKAEVHARESDGGVYVTVRVGAPMRTLTLFVHDPQVLDRIADECRRAAADLVVAQGRAEAVPA